MLAIARPDLRVTLVEATQKKAAFLSAVSAAMGLSNVSVRAERAEQLGRGELEGAFDVVTARAVARLIALAPLTLPFARPGGLVLLIKGQRADEELAEARSVHRQAARASRADDCDAHRPRRGPPTQALDARLARAAVSCAAADRQDRRICAAIARAHDLLARPPTSVAGGLPSMSIDYASKIPNNVDLGYEQDRSSERSSTGSRGTSIGGARWAPTGAPPTTSTCAPR